MNALLQDYLPLVVFIAVALVIGLALLVVGEAIRRLMEPDVKIDAGWPAYEKVGRRVRWFREAVRDFLERTALPELRGHGKSGGKRHGFHAIHR